MGVACVENTSLVYPILKDTREPTQEKDHITVTSVKSLSVCYTVYSVISLYTQDLNPFIVVSVGTQIAKCIYSTFIFGQIG